MTETEKRVILSKAWRRGESLPEHSGRLLFLEGRYGKIF
jgi:hypothetical protein